MRRPGDCEAEVQKPSIEYLMRRGGNLSRELSEVNSQLFASAEALLQEAVGSSMHGSWDLSGCSFSIQNGFLVLSNMSMYQYASAGADGFHGKRLDDILQLRSLVFHFSEQSGRIQIFLPLPKEQEKEVQKETGC